MTEVAAPYRFRDTPEHAQKRDAVVAVFAQEGFPGAVVHDVDADADGYGSDQVIRVPGFGRDDLNRLSEIVNGPLEAAGFNREYYYSDAQHEDDSFVGATIHGTFDPEVRFWNGIALD